MTENLLAKKFDVFRSVDGQEVVVAHVSSSAPCHVAHPPPCRSPNLAMPLGQVKKESRFTGVGAFLKSTYTGAQ